MLAGLVFALGMALTFCGLYPLRQHHVGERETQFDFLVHRATDQLSNRLLAYEAGLRGIRGLAIGSGADQLTRRKFHEYMASRNMLTEFPGALGYGFIRRVAMTDQERFTAEARRDGWPDFALRYLTPHQGDRWVIQYIEPEAANRLAIGLDISSESSRLRALTAAVHNNAATLTEPITLVQQSGKANRGFLLMLPIFRTGYAPATPAQRWQQAVGLTYAPVLIDEVMRGFDFRGGEFSLTIATRSQSGGLLPAYASAGSDQPPSADLQRRVPLQIFGQTWVLHFKARPAFLAALNQLDLRWVLLQGLFLSALLAALTYLFQMGRQRHLQALKTQARLGAIVSHASDAMIGLDRHGRITSWNQAAVHFFGQSEAEVLGTSLASVLLPAMSREQLDSMLAALAEGELVSHFLIRLPRADQPVLHLGVTASPIRGGEGEILGSALLLRDLSSEVESERQIHDLNASLEAQVGQRTAELERVLRENEVLLRTINQQMLYSVTDVAGRILEVNDNFCELSGYSREELLGQNHRKINSNVHPPEFWRHVWGEISQGKSWHGEVCNRDKKGGLYWVDSVIAPFIGSNGRVERYVSMRTNITRRKQAEAQFRQATDLLQNVLSAASEVSIIATDCQGVITLFNAGAENLLQYAADEVIGRCTPTIFHCPEEVMRRGRELGEQLGEPVEGFRVFVQLPERDGMESREWTYVRKDGQRIHVSLVVTVIRGDQGEITGYLAVAQDITVRISYEQALVEAKLSAESANQAKSEFLANMSHEIRTPMNGILGLCYLLERQPLADETRAMVRKVQGASQSLLAIINDILDFSKIEARRLELERAPFSLAALVDQLRGLFQASLQDRPVGLLIEPVPAQISQLVGDSLRLNQILTNLLSNAVKFTRQGQVSLTVTALGETPCGHQRVRFTVADTGIGIPEEKLDSIFQAFSQADSSISRSFGGTGLGLAISHRLVTLMGGEMKVQSQLGQGSRFEVEIAFECPRQPMLLPEAEVVAEEERGYRRLSGVRILLADDSELNRDVARSILVMEGAEVTTVVDGLAAVEQLRSHPDAHDLVLMDVQMPVLDGYAATRLIRDSLQRSDLPILALTAGAMSGQRDKALAAGMNGFVTKPFQVDLLVREIRACLPQPAHVLALTVTGPAAPVLAESSSAPQPVAEPDRQLSTEAQARPDPDPEIAAALAVFRQRYLDERLPQQLTTLEGCLEQSATLDVDLLRRTLHSMAGEAGMVGLVELGRRARELEYQLDQNVEAVRLALPDLVAMVRAVPHQAA